MRFNEGVKLSRRAVLRGCAGSAVATVALPLLDAMLDGNGEALADGSPLPRRFVTFHFGNGVILPSWTPAATGLDWELTPLLAPLAPVKAHCSVLTGFGVEAPAFYPHHAGMTGMWAGAAPIPNGSGTMFPGPSADQLVADAIGTETRLKSIEIAVSKRVALDGGPTLMFLSHRSGLAPLPPIASPAAVWERLFWDPALAPLASVRATVLDAVANDAKRLKLALGATDRARLDAHLEGIAELRDQVLLPLPADPAAGQGMPQPSETNHDTNGVEPLGAVSNAMIALVAHAFRCDVTRVASVLLTGPSCKTVYAHLGHSEEQHVMTHSPDEANMARIHDSVVWNVQQFASLVQALAGIPEGNGTVLDRTVAVLGSDCIEGWTHAISELPCVIAGGGGGALVQGAHVRQPGRRIADAVVTAMHAAAPSIGTFGTSDQASTGLVSELLA